MKEKSSFGIDTVKLSFEHKNLKLFVDEKILSDVSSNTYLERFVKSVNDGLRKFIKTNQFMIECMLFYEREYYSPENIKLMLMVDFGTRNRKLKRNYWRSLQILIENSFNEEFDFNDINFTNLYKKFYIVPKGT